MHILILPAWYPSDANAVSGSFFREQALALSKAGCKVGVLHQSLVSLRTPKRAFSVRVEQDQSVITYRQCSLNLFPKLPALQYRLLQFKGLQLFKRYVEQEGLPDVIHVHGLLNAGLIAEVIQQHYPIPYVITEHSSAYARGMVTEQVLTRFRPIAAQAAMRFCVSQAFSRQLTQQFQLSWQVFPNMVSDLFFQPRQPKTAQLTQASMHFLTLSMLNANKRVDLVIQAFAEAFKGQAHVQLTIAGDGPERHALVQQVQSAGVQDQIRFVGGLTRAQAAQQMDQADGFVLASDYETFGVVVIEALAKGVPVIATRCGGPEDSVRPGLDGLLVETGDVSALANAMRQLSQQRANYPASRLRQDCYTRFSETCLTQQLMTHYRQVIAPHTEQTAT